MKELTNLEYYVLSAVPKRGKIAFEALLGALRDAEVVFQVDDADGVAALPEDIELTAGDLREVIMSLVGKGTLAAEGGEGAAIHRTKRGVRIDYNAEYRQYYGQLMPAGKAEPMCVNRNAFQKFGMVVLGFAVLFFLFIGAICIWLFLSGDVELPMFFGMFGIYGVLMVFLARIGYKAFRRGRMVYWRIRILD